MCILTKTDSLLNVTRNKVFLPSSDDKSYAPDEKDLEQVRDDFSDQFEYPEVFEQTAPVHRPGEKLAAADVEQLRKTNNQTKLICQMLGIRNPIDVILNRTIQPIELQSTTN